MQPDEIKALQDAIDEEEDPKGKRRKDVSLDGWWKVWGKIVGDNEKPLTATQIVPTGLPQIDIALEIGGIPMGCIMSVWGSEGSAKTTLAQVIVGQIQKQYPDKVVVWIDAEHSFNGPIAQRNGMTITKELFEQHKLIFLNPDLDNGLSYEKAITMVEQLMTANPSGIVFVVDSLDAMSTASEIAKSAEDGGASFGGMAKTNSITLKRIVGQIRRTNSIMIVIQQLRDKVGAMGYGEQTDTSGGHAVKHYSAIRIQLKPIGRIKSTDDEILGHTVRAMVTKNKYGRSWVQFEFDLYYAHDDSALGGIDRAGGLIDVGKKLGIVVVSGASHVFLINPDGTDDFPLKVNGRQKARKWLIENPKYADRLRQEIMTRLGI